MVATSDQLNRSPLAIIEKSRRYNLFSTQVYYEPARTQVKRAFQDAMDS